MLDKELALLTQQYYGLCFSQTAYVILPIIVFWQQRSKETAGATPPRLWAEISLRYKASKALTFHQTFVETCRVFPQFSKSISAIDGANSQANKLCPAWNRALAESFIPLGKRVEPTIYIKEG